MKYYFVNLILYLSVKNYKVLCYSFFTKFIKKSIYTCWESYNFLSLKSLVLNPKNGLQHYWFFLIYLYTNHTSLILYYLVYLYIFYGFYVFYTFFSVIFLTVFHYYIRANYFEHSSVISYSETFYFRRFFFTGCMSFQI